MAQVLVMGLILVGLVVLFVDASGRPRAHLFPDSRRARLRRLSSPKAKDCGLESRRPASTEVRSTIVQTDNAVVDREVTCGGSLVSSLRCDGLERHSMQSTPPQTDRGIWPAIGDIRCPWMTRGGRRDSGARCEDLARCSGAWRAGNGPVDNSMAP